MIPLNVGWVEERNPTSL